MTPEQRLDKLEQEMREHYHNGVVGRLINFADLFGYIKTITVAAELTAILASKPTKIPEQILIDTTTATKRLYIYDLVGDVWRKVTIA